MLQLDPQGMARLNNHIAQHWHRGCPMCAHPQWSVLGYTMTTVSATGHTAWGAQGIPTIALACNRCGFVVQVTRAAVGLG